MLVLSVLFVGSCKPEDDPSNDEGDNPGQPVNPDIEGPDIRTFTVEDVSFDMRKVQGGTYWMGAQQDDENGQNYDPQCNAEETPPHQVTMSGFYMGKYEVTQELWRAVMGNLNKLWQCCCFYYSTIASADGSNRFRLLWLFCGFWPL
jgi:hypothetical protein